MIVIEKRSKRFPFVLKYTHCHIVCHGQILKITFGLINQKVSVAEMQMIPNLKGLINDYLHFEVQVCGSNSKNHETFLEKSTLFKEEVVWQPLI